MKKAGTALLLSCAKTSNVAPCITSTRQVGHNVVVKLYVPGGDPVLKIVTNPKAKINLPTVPTGKVGHAYSGRLTTSGGLAPIVWKVASGRLPAGLRLNAKTGAITGTPAAEGRTTFVLQASDAEKPPETARMGLTITVNS